MSLIRLQKISRRYQMGAVAQASSLCVGAVTKSQAGSLCHHEPTDNSFAKRNSDALFPLTLTLSLGEREQPKNIFLKLEVDRAEAAVSFAKKEQPDFVKILGAFLPLPKGEGRGEGKENIHSRERTRSARKFTLFHSTLGTSYSILS